MIEASEIEDAEEGGCSAHSIKIAGTIMMMPAVVCRWVWLLIMIPSYCFSYLYRGMTCAFCHVCCEPACAF